MKRSLVMKRGTAVTLVLAALPLLGFKPFTAVKSVCPTCESQRFDTVVLLSGRRIAANVVVQNQDYYVLRRLGEVRVVAKSEVGSIQAREAAKTGAKPGDQLILKNGLVLHGRIVKHVSGRYFVILAGGKQHVAWVSRVEKAYKAGKRLERM